MSTYECVGQWSPGGSVKGLESWPTGRMLVVAARLAERRFQEWLDAHGVTIAGLHVLMVLRGGPRTQVEVANACAVRSQTIGRTIDRLARSGLVTRERDPGDRRRLLVTLTDRGQELAATISTEGARRPAGLAPSPFEELPDPERFRADLALIIRRLWAGQAADRAEQWAAAARRWAAFAEGAADTPPRAPYPPMPPRPQAVPDPMDLPPPSPAHEELHEPGARELTDHRR